MAAGKLLSEIVGTAGLSGGSKGPARSRIVGPAYFVIAILGCADGAAACTPVATLPTRYESAAECSSATSDPLAASSDLDFPTMLATCVPGLSRPAAEAVPETGSDDAQSA